MEQRKSIVQLKTTATESARVGETSVVLQAQALIVRLPFGGLVWNRPLVALVEQHGIRRRIWIIDWTRVLQIAAWAMTVLFIIGWRRRRKGVER